MLEKYRSKLFTPGFYLLLVISIINLYFILEITPQSNDECLWLSKKAGPDSTVVIFDQVKVNGVTWQAGIRDGDRLVAVNGVEIRNPASAQYILNQVASGDTAFYVYERNNELIETSVEIKKLVNFGNLALTLLALIWLIVGFVVIKAKPEGYTQLLFFRIGALLALFSSVSLLNDNFGTNPIFESTPIVFTVLFVWSFAGAFLPFVIIHFFLLFPKKYKLLNKKYIIRILYYTPTLIYLSCTAILVYELYNLATTASIYIFYMIQSLFILVYIGAVIGLILLIISYFRLKNKNEKRPIFVIVIAYSLGALAMIYSGTLAGVLAGPIFNNPEFFIPVILIVLIPLSFAYSVFKYSLMDVSDVVKNAVFYGVATAALAGIYFMLIYLAGQSVSAAIGTEYQGLIAGVVFIAFALLFQNTKDKFQEVITRRFYPEQFAYQKVLLKFSSDIPTVVGLDNILNSTCDIFVESLRITKFGILIRGEDQTVYNLVRSYGFDGELGIIEDEEHLLDKRLEEKKSLGKQQIIEKEEFNEVFLKDAEYLHNEGIYTLVPLIIKSKVIGFFLFGLKYSGARFAGKDLELLIAAANQTAVSIENARLYESEADKMKIQHDLENARKIQESLLPHQIPQFDKLEICGTMIPAMQVGGDYFDVIKVSDSKVFVIVGDVSGKGLSASFYMSKLQTMMKLYCNENASPKEVLIEINKHIYRSIEKNWFITAAVGLFDLDSKKLKYCRAGHTPLLIINQNRKNLFQPGGLGLGLEKGEVFDTVIEEVDIDLQSECNYVFFSDGLSESMNEKNEMFGLRRLEDIICEDSHKSCIDIMKKTLSSVSSFRGKAHQNDDITFVIVKFKR